MDYVKFITERYIKTGRKGYTVYDADITTQRQLKEQGFEDNIGGYSGFLHYQQDNNLTVMGKLCSNKPGCYGDYDGELKINQIAMEIGDPINEVVVGGWFNRETIKFSKKIVFENKSMDVDDIERAFMWFESFKSYHGYSSISEEFHELLYNKLIETGKYRTRDFKKDIFD